MTKNILRGVNFTNLKTSGGYIVKSKPQGVCLQLSQTLCILAFFFLSYEIFCRLYKISKFCGLKPLICWLYFGADTVCKFLGHVSLIWPNLIWITILQVHTLNSTISAIKTNLQRSNRVSLVMQIRCYLFLFLFFCVCGKNHTAF